jgi:hypothetical protein
MNTHTRESASQIGIATGIGIGIRIRIGIRIGIRPGIAQPDNGRDSSSGMANGGDYHLRAVPSGCVAPISAIKSLSQRLAGTHAGTHA